MSSTILFPFLPCLGLSRKPTSTTHGKFQTLSSRYTDNDNPMTEKSLAEAQTAADNLLTILLTTENPSTDPRRQSYLHPSLPTIQSQTWKEYVAKLILSGLEAAIRNGVIVGKAMKDAIDKAITAATGFAKEHPVYFTLIALGVLVIQAPEILGWLGFAEVGIVEDSFAALWQARYAGYVPKGSLFSYFQRLGMVWRR